jgi:hypothetical protein
VTEPIKQPEALWLAEWLESDYYDDVRVTAAAAELRRQHAEIETLRDSCAAKADRIDRLGEQIVKLRAEVERLREVLECIATANTMEDYEYRYLARAALKEPE